MPTERFYRLPREKQTVIKDAAFREFASATLDQVSINRIIKDADISRGSFYTYFEDKWDLLAYILESLEKSIERVAQRTLDQTDGDVWEMFRAVFQTAIEFGRDPQARAFIGNILVRSNTEATIQLFPCVDDVRMNETVERRLRAFYSAYKDKQFRNISFSRFQNFMQIAKIASLYELRQFAGGIEEETVLRNYYEKLEILRAGVGIFEEGN